MTSVSASGQYLISVVVPVYNAEHFLERSINSVVNQSHRNIQLILVDDGSTDRSLDFCKQYATTDGRIKVLTQLNAGPAAARNTGVRSAKGDFVFFLDADDYIVEKTFEILLDAYCQSSADLVMANFSKLENDGTLVQKDVVFRPDGDLYKGKQLELSADDVLLFVRHFLKSPSNHLISYCWARLYKLSIIRDYQIAANEDMRLFEDFVFNLDYLKHANRVTFVNQHLYVYVMHNAHVSASMGVFQADSLLHDMGIFSRITRNYLRDGASNREGSEVAAQAVGHTLIHYLIIFLVRACRMMTSENKSAIRNEIDKMVKSDLISSSLQHYQPARGNSRMLPVLMKLRFVNLIMNLCHYKANKRYGKATAS